MCGILGVYNLKGPEVDIESTKLMGEELKHRGPDSEGTILNITWVFITNVLQF